MSRDADGDLERLLGMLDRLEELREDLLELGVESLSDIEERIAEIEASIHDSPELDNIGDGGSRGSL